LRDRIKKLEEGKEESVEDVFSKLSSLLVRKNPPFDKDVAFDVLIELKAVARSSNHAKLPYFQAVFQALKDKTSASPDKFRKYWGLSSGTSIKSVSWRSRLRSISLFGDPHRLYPDLRRLLLQGPRGLF